MRWSLLLFCLAACDADTTAAQADGAGPGLDARPLDAMIDGSTILDGAVDAEPRDAGGDGSARDAEVDAGASDAGPDADVDAAPPPGCARYSGAIHAGTLDGADLAEVSGIAASRQTPGVFWVHNDSGNAPRLYAIGADGRLRAQVELPGVVEDLEDVAVARCPTSERWCVWVADSGDNRRVRDSVSIFIVPEPPVGEGDGGLIVVDGITRLERRHADGPHDIEALAVEPAGDRLWLFSKTEDGPTLIFTSDTDAQPADLRLAGQFDAPGVAVPMGRMVTGADLHPSGARLAIRVYTGSYEYWLGAGGVPGLADQVARQVILGPLSEPQGEAIGYGADGLSLWTVSESPAGNQPLHRYDCAD